MNKAIEQLHFDSLQHSFHQHKALIDQVLRSKNRKFDFINLEKITS
jgi:hypothetical protein